MQFVRNWFQMREVFNSSLWIVFAELQGLFMMYTSRVFLISFSVLEATVISMISDVSDLFSPPARFIVRWVAVPAIPSHTAAFSDRRLVFDTESIIASISTSVPPESITLTFRTGHKPVMSLTSFLLSAVQLVLPSAGTSCIRKGTAFGLRFELIVSL